LAEHPQVGNKVGKQIKKIAIKIIKNKELSATQTWRMMALHRSLHRVKKTPYCNSTTT
jgi:hypothetical protein